MALDPTRHFADRVTHLKASEIREILLLTQKPEVISFAGGLPDPQSFPVEVVKELSQRLLSERGTDVLQYGLTKGVPELRSAVSELMAAEGVQRDPDEMLITSGSQQGVNITCQLLLQPGAKVVVGSPTYLGLKLLLQYHQAQPVPVRVDDDGMDPASVEETLISLQKAGTPPAFIYVMPTFQNPAGVTISEERRKRLVDLASAYDTLIVEDDPYSRLRFEGDFLKPLMAYDDEQRVIYLSTFSKLLAPGLRVAWAMAHPDILQKMNLAKQGDDLHANTFGQYVTAAYLNEGHFASHVETIRSIYRAKRDVMLGAMEELFPDDVRWTHPQGGLFTWVTGPEGLDSTALLKEAIARNVAFVTGPAFHTAAGAGTNCLRLNFSHPSHEKIRAGVERLAEALQAHLGKLPSRSGGAVGTT